MSELIAKSIASLHSIHLQNIWAEGVRRDPNKYHIAMMYPSLKSMHDIASDQIFNELKSPANSFRIYMHIPFCTGNCIFCYFCKISKYTDEIVSKYLEALKTEIALVGSRLNEQYPDMHIHAVFFGGGSPSILNDMQVEQILKQLKSYFPISEQTEVTMELHPEIIRDHPPDYLVKLRGLGINRVSIGVQSFDDRILKLVNRRHSKEEALNLFQMARTAGFENINIDLLQLLPDLTPDLWEETLNCSYQLEPDSITTYMTSVRKGTNLRKMYESKAFRFPNEYLTNLHRIMAIEKAKQQEYDYKRTVDYFIKPKKSITFTQTKTESQKIEATQYIGLGLASINYQNFFQYYNTPYFNAYLNALQSNRLPVWKGIQLDQEQRLVRAVFLGIKSGSINLSKLNEHFHVNFEEKFESIILRLIRLNLVEKVDDVLRLTLAGYLYAEETGIEFIPDKMKESIRTRNYPSDEEKQLFEERDFLYKFD